MENGRGQDQEDPETRTKLIERSLARRHRQFCYVVRRIRENDPTITSLTVNLRCGYELSSGIALPPLFRALTQERNTSVTNLSIFNCDSGGSGRDGGVSPSSGSSVEPFEGSSPIMGVGRMLLTNSKLQHVTLRDCNLLWIHVIPIFKSLIKNKFSALESLNLCNNKQLFSHRRQHQGEEFSPTTARSSSPLCLVSKVLGQCLTQNKTLKAINFSNTGLSSDTINEIFRGLERNTTLESLNISHNDHIAIDIVNALIRSLPKLRGLQQLDVQYTKVSQCFDQDPKFMERFVASYRQNYRLWKLDTITLHSIEHYKNDSSKNSEIQLEKQRLCFRYLQEFNCLKCRNGLLAGGLVTIDDYNNLNNRQQHRHPEFPRSLWSHILAQIVSSQKMSKDGCGVDRCNMNHRYCHDMIYFLLREKSDIFFHPRMNDSNTIAAPMTSASSQNPKLEQRKQPSSVKSSRSKRKEQAMKKDHAIKGTSRKKQKRAHGISNQATGSGDPGFYCRIHVGGNNRLLLPIECCSFETMEPFQKKKQLRLR